MIFNCRSMSKLDTTRLGSQINPSKIRKFTESNTCYTTECNKTALEILEYMDENNEPCDDFYKFVCGNFVKKTVIPDDEISVNNFETVRNILVQQMRDIVSAESKPDDPKSFEFVKNLYSVCMNETLAEEEGLAPLHNILKELGGWPVLEGDKWDEDNFSWKESVYKLRKKGYSTGYFLTFDIVDDFKNNSRRVIVLDQASLGLSNRYLKKGMKNKIVEAYSNYMVDIAVMLGADKDRAESELLESLQFEIKLASISLLDEERRNTTALYHIMTVNELVNKYPSIPWLEYLNIMVAPVLNINGKEPIWVIVPSYISELEKLLNETSKRILANYVMWRVAKKSVNFLSREIREKQLTFQTITTGRVKNQPRWKECTEKVSSVFPITISSLYVRKYFNEDARNNTREMVSNIRQKFIQILQTVDWMDEDTRRIAVDKAKSMSEYIAYPEELLNNTKVDKVYDKVHMIPGHNLLQISLDFSLIAIELALKKLRKPVKRNKWIRHGMSADVNAYYSTSDNSIEFPAGILQGTYFNAKRPRYTNYGAIGTIIGHEITHGFDDMGSQFDKEGKATDWWKNKTKTEFLKRVQCVIDQANNYTVSGTSLKINGINTQGENLADYGGIKVAYLAYNEWKKHHGEEQSLPGLQNYSSKQMFWISAAHMWCDAIRPESIELIINMGSHSPNEFRINGPLSNLPEFARDFNCSLGSKMNPRGKCTVW
ncbi:hypothetical protein QAD02_009874 [Eretmocerus hayati]|uniref:Uncharacterized protein n=1 Tax=Eretmocerus hayati TaxID=131215 RepID=A0ACC2NAY3_9HYME|nr:hypothetical protein QAD02_009874 [Eretmocerus hayati]